MALIQIITTYDQGEYSACEALWYELAEVALSEGHQIEIVTGRLSQGYARLQALIEKGARVCFYPSPPASGKLRLLLHKVWLRYRAAASLNRKINQRVDLRLLNVGTMVEAAREPWARLLEVSPAPTALIVHNNPEIRPNIENQDRRLARILSACRRVYFVSERLRTNVEEQLLQSIPGATLVKNPVNLNSREMEPWPEQDVLKLAVVGRLDAFVKGQVRLLHALSSHKWKDRSWQLSIFGSGPDREKIQQAIDFYELQEHVTFGGFVDDVRSEIWKSHHVLVMPSMLEGLPLTLIEAMVCGRPAVCSDVGGASELIRDAENGYLAGSPFTNQLSEALERLWANRYNLQQMGEQAHLDGVHYLPTQPGRELLGDIFASVANPDLKVECRNRLTSYL